MALSRKRIGDARLFRIRGCGEVVVIREDLREALHKAGVSGCGFGRLRIT
jgi:hypothetical protein